MTDEPRSEGTETGIAEQPTEPIVEETAPAEDEPLKLHQAVEMYDVGPCKKHIKITIERGDIESLMDKEFSKLVLDSNVPGFRPGKAPRQIIQRRFRRDVTEQVKNQILLQSLEQRPAQLQGPEDPPAGTRHQRRGHHR
jgi:trigger factor